MGILLPGQWAEFDDRIDKAFDVRTKNLPNYMEQLFNVQDTDSIEERSLGIGAMGKAMPWGGTVHYSDYAKGYETTYRQARYSNGIQLDEMLIRYKQYKEIAKRTIKAADIIYKTKEYYGASVFNNAFNDAYTSLGDAVGLCSTAHPLSPENAATQSNEDTLSLNVTNFELTRQRMMQFKDDNGDLMVGMMPNIILVGTEQEKTAKQIVYGDKYDAFQANFNINIYSGDFQVIVNPHITGKKWFMIAGMEMNTALNWYWGRRFKPERETDFDAEVIKYKLVGDFVWGWDDYRFIYGNNPSS